MGLLYVAVNRQTKQLVAFNGSATDIPTLFQSSTVTLRVSVVDSTGSLTAPLVAVDEAGLGMRAWIGPTPIGGAESPDTLALNASLTWNATNKWFQGDISLANTDVDTFILGVGSKTAFLELTEIGTNRETLLQRSFTLAAVGDEGSSSAPAPADSYYTKAESLIVFMPRTGANGDRLVLKSANGVYAVELGCNDDGSVLMNQITL